MQFRFVILLVVSLALAACATRPQPQSPGPLYPTPPQQPQKPSQKQPKQQNPGTGQQPHQPPGKQQVPKNAAQASGSAVRALLKQASQLHAAGHLDRASALLERALVIAPRNPFVYQRLASLRLDQGKPMQAESLAQKANSLAGNNPYVKQGNWQVIAKARSVHGDNLGADQASTMAAYYRHQIQTGQ